MRITNLTCKNFRSYRRLSLSFSSQFIVFFGENGAGKTNILEAISLFSPERGLRKASSSDINARDAEPLSWSIDLRIEKGNCSTYLSTGVVNGRRCAKADNMSLNSLAKFEDDLWIIWIVPSMDMIFIGQSSDRRSFFDHLVSGYFKNHKEKLKKILQLQKERLHVIFSNNDNHWLSAIEEKISLESIDVTKNRYEFIRLLKNSFQNSTSRFLRPIVDLNGEIESIYNSTSEENATLEIASLLRKNRVIDADKQTTSVGVHKSMWQAYHPATNIEAANCSTGEQKAFLISLVLGAVRVYKNIKRGIPILLMDDLMSHLDQKRRKFLAEELTSLNVQVFFTGNDSNLFKDLPDSTQIYFVEKSICKHL